MSIAHKEDNAHFISLSDMMTALMTIFLFISVAIMLQVQEKTEDIKKLTSAYYQTHEDILKALIDEFGHDFAEWDAYITLDGSIVFSNPEVLFDSGDVNIKPRFQEILSDFFPRYVAIIKDFKDSIKEIRLEGYTDTDGKAGANQTLQEKYFYNMELSQGRTRSVLNYCLNLPNFSDDDFNELKELITANGLSFSHLKKDMNGVEDKQASRRVEFTILTKDKDKIDEIKNRLNN